jgi:hypothetical protein
MSDKADQINVSGPPDTSTSKIADSIKRLLRLKGLIIAIVAVYLLGRYVLGDHVDATLNRLWIDIKHQYEIFSVAGVVKAATLWVRRMGWYWVTREIPKKIAVGIALSYGVTWMMTTEQKVRLQDYAKQTKKRWMDRVIRLNTWLKRDDVFGPLSGWAIGLLLSLILLLVFYALFWVWIIIALGFLKMPPFLLSFGRTVAQKLGFILQKIPFGKGLGRITDPVWAFVVRWLGRLRIWKPKTPEQIRQRRIRQIKITRAVIKSRNTRNAAWAAFWSRIPVGVSTPEVLQLQAEKKVQRHAYWKKVIQLEREGVPSLQNAAHSHAGDSCCEPCLLNLEDAPAEDSVAT